MHRVERLSHQLQEGCGEAPLAHELSSASFAIPAHVAAIREKVLRFIEDEVYPFETEFAQIKHLGPSNLRSFTKLREIQQKAKDQGLWALGHPKEIGGGGMPFMDYVYVNEVQGRSEIGQVCLGTYTLQDSLMLMRHGTEAQKAKYLSRLVAAEISPSFAMTEPGIVSSDPTAIQTEARVDGKDFVINGRKWFTTNASSAEYTCVMARTEFDKSTPIHQAFSIILVPTNTPGYNIVRNTHLLGLTESAGHAEVRYDNVRVKIKDSLLGQRGMGFLIAQQRLGPGRIFHCMRWLGQAQRAFDLMCKRLNTRKVRGKKLGSKQLMQKHVFDSFSDIQACRLLTLDAARKIDAGGLAIDPSARIAIGAIKVTGAHMLHNVIDRAIQVFGAAGLTEDFPLSSMYRHARFGRIYDGPDEVHIQSVARNILREYDAGKTWDFGKR